MSIKVGLIVDEYFGGLGTAFGGYGFLARRYIAKYIPNEEIQIHVLLGKGKSYFFHEENMLNGVKLFRLPRLKQFAKFWLKRQNYDVYLSIELIYTHVLECESDRKKKLILWIQDPRPQYEWDEIQTVNLLQEHCYYKQRIYDLVNKWHHDNRIKFISQAEFLNRKAIDLYHLEENVPIQLVHNPVDIDFTFTLDHGTKNESIIFLGRIESVKRGWLFCEIAKLLPQFEFYVLGQTFRDQSNNSRIMNSYTDIHNLHFEGHVDGESKKKFIKNAAILVNTSIHEALPVSFLEALSYGTLIVSNRNPEGLTSRFGAYVGQVLGDGFESVPVFAKAILELMESPKKRLELGRLAIEYIRKEHNVNDFVNTIRALIKTEAHRS